MRPRDKWALCSGLLPLLERLDHVLDLDVVERAEPDAALETFTDLRRVVLEPLERVDGQVVGHDHTVTYQARLALGPDVVADDDGIRGDRQVDVVLGDRTHTAADHPQRHLISGVRADVDLDQRVLERLDRTRHIALDDQVELLDLAGGESLVEVVERDPLAAGRQSCVALARLPPIGDLPGDAVLVDDEERVAGTGHRGQPQYLDGARRTGHLDEVAVLVVHRTHATMRVAGHDRVTDVQGAALDEQRRHRTAAAVEPCLDDDALSVLVGVGAQVERRVSREQDAFEQAVDVEVGTCGDVDEHRVAAVLLGDQPVLGELLAHLGRVGTLLVDLVDRDHDGYLRRLRVVERLDRLRHDAVVGRNHEHHDVGGRRAAGTHGRERLVARRVDERDRPVGVLVLDVHLVGTDVLGDAACLDVHDVGLADRVEQPGLAVVDVAHHGHDRRARLQVTFDPFVSAERQVERVQQFAVLVLGADHLHRVVQLGAEQLQGLLVHRLGGGDHLAEMEHHRHQRCRVGVDLLREVDERCSARQAQNLAVAARNLHAADRRGLHVVELLAALLLTLAPTGRASALTTEGAGRAGSATTSTWTPAAGPAAETAARTATWARAAGTTARATAAGTTAISASAATAGTS